MYKLRELNKEDMPTINNWRNDSELINYLGAPFRYINLAVDYQWYDNYMQNRSNNVRCAIVKIPDENNILGIVSLTGIDVVNRTAEFHIMIGDKQNRESGIGHYATIEILKHAFNNLNLNRIELSVLESNLRAISLYEKVGFISEGILRQSIYKEGEYVNTKIMSILKDEFLKNPKRGN